jgi:hypothetical protein
VQELALGYQGGVGAFQTMAKGYGVEIADEKAALKALKAGGYKLDQLAPRALLSPAQAEKIVGKDPVAPLVERPLGSWRLVPDTDPRPAVSAIDVFEEES